MLRDPLRCEDAARPSPLRYASGMLRDPLPYASLRGCFAIHFVARMLRDPLRCEDAALSAPLPYASLRGCFATLSADRGFANRKPPVSRAIPRQRHGSIPAVRHRLVGGYHMNVCGDALSAGRAGRGYTRQCLGTSGGACRRYVLNGSG